MTIMNYEAPTVVRYETPQDVAVRRLGEWAQSADAAFKVAQRLVESSFVPAAFKGKPIEATAAILAGMEVGLQPMASLRGFDVIQGQAAPRALTLRAIVQSYGHDMQLVESTTTRCRMRGRRKGSDEWTPVSWTIDRAKAMQLTGKDNWKKQPDAMLVARATSELARLIAADAILGIGYSSEELADGGETVTQADAPAAPESNGARRMSRTKPAPEADPLPTPEPAAAPEPITDAQLTKLMATFNDIGIKDRKPRLDYCIGVIGHDIASSKELTKTEASAIIDDIERALSDSGEPS